MSTNTRFPSPVSWLAGAIVVASLSGCLGSSSSSNSTDATPPPSASLVRTTSYGDVEGESRTGYNAFLGIPYAAPPVGDLRFAAPTEPANWSGVRAATAYGSDCPQTGVTSDAAEDCLYLNVFTPTSEGPHPVMVWMHGGAFIFGSGAGTYVPPRLVGNDVVVVTINYRLGRLGFLAHPALSAEASGASGSYGIMDQQLALQWVKDNIENFGGDADNVTLFGQSAGGLSVLSHLVSPASAELFDKAIVQSGAYSQVQTSLAAAETNGIVFANDAGCDDPEQTPAEQIACMRELSVAEILATPAGSITPTLRPDILPTSVGPALLAGEFNDVPVMTGSTTEEYSYFLAIGDQTPITADNYVARLGGLGFAAGFYDVADYDNDYAKLVTAVYTDYVFACNAGVQADRLTANGTAGIYAYEFADRDAPPILPFPAWLSLGATHASEIQYLFGSDSSFAAAGATEEQVELARVMTRAWTDFARNGDPNPSDGTYTWPEYTGATRPMVSFEPPGTAALNRSEFRAAHKCAIWTP